MALRVDVGAVVPEMTAPERALPDVAGLARFAPTEQSWELLADTRRLLNQS